MTRARNPDGRCPMDRLAPVLVAVPLLLGGCAGESNTVSPSDSRDSSDGPARSDLDRSGTLWGSHLEWSLANPSYAGNPFDLEAAVTFTHVTSGEGRTTGMFYAGDSRWSFRFTGTRTGTWTFTTSSSDPELDDMTGTVEISPQADPDLHGLLTTRGNKFARWTGTGNLDPFLVRIFADASNEVAARFGCDDYEDMRCWSEAFIRAYAEKAREHGMSHIFLFVAHQWFRPGSRRHTGHSETNPSLESFRVLERAIQVAREEGVAVHLWVWGDESRAMTPVGLPGGVNGEVDRRLQRYIAARLGPLPGWTLGYGFDLREWVSAAEADDWARFLHEAMGWDHLLWARNLDGPSLDVESVGGAGPESYRQAASHVDSDRPHLEEERFLYRRDLWGRIYTMDRTMDLLWWMAMAGGSAGFWGTADGAEYPEPVRLRTYARFWRDRLRFGMEPADGLTDGYALATDGGAPYVFYCEGAATVEMDLRRMAGARRAVAVDARGAYREIEVGTLAPGRHTWDAPYRSDWAIAVGE